MQTRKTGSESGTLYMLYEVYDDNTNSAAANKDTVWILKNNNGSFELAKKLSLNSFQYQEITITGIKEIFQTENSFSILGYATLQNDTTKHGDFLVANLYPTVENWSDFGSDNWSID